MKELMENWRRFADEESSPEEVEEGTFKNLALGAAMAGQLATASPSLAADTPQEPPAATQQTPQDQEQVAIGEKAQLLTIYKGVVRIKNPYLKNIIEWGAKTGKVNTFKELMNYIKAKGGLSPKDMAAFKAAFQRAGDHFHKNPESRAAKWDAMAGQSIKEEEGDLNNQVLVLFNPETGEQIPIPPDLLDQVLASIKIANQDAMNSLDEEVKSS